MINYKKKYLTSEEIQFILNDVLALNTAFEREVVKTALIAQLISDDFSDENVYPSANAIFDEIIKNEDYYNLYDNVLGTDIVDNLIEKELSTETTVKHFLAELSTKIDEYAKSVNVEQFSTMIEEFKKISEKK